MSELLADETIAIQQQEIHRLESREREVAVILATALACGGYQSQHGHWIKDAAAWLNARTGT